LYHYPFNIQQTAEHLVDRFDRNDIGINRLFLMLYKFGYNSAFQE